MTTTPRRTVRRSSIPAKALVALLAAAVGSANAASAGDLIGRTVPPYPDGLLEQQGVCIGSETDGGSVCDDGIAMLGKPSPRESEPSRPLFVIGQRMIGRDGDHVRWQITDAVKAPKLKRGYLLEIASCRFGGHADESMIVALVRYRDDRETSADVIWARRLDPATGRLLSIRGRIECINQAAGI